MGLVSAPICMDPVKWTLLLLCAESVHFVSTVPLPCMGAPQVRIAVMPLGRFWILLISHPALAVGLGPLYLSRSACVKHTWAECGAPDWRGSFIPAGNGECCQVILLVTS